tara:strand:+ start:1257 stop:2090 length:834 start_codon:yes stop_codon:yes gene_type:complete
MISDSIIVMAAGASTRMKNSNFQNKSIDYQQTVDSNKSKSLIRFGKESKPFISFLISNISNSGFKNIYIVVPENLKKYFNQRVKKELKIKINLSFQLVPKNRSKPLGTADAVYQTMQQFPELKLKPFCICNGDNLYSIASLKKIRLSKFNYAFIAYDSKGLEFSQKKISSFSVIQLDKENRLVSIIEKPPVKLMPKFVDKNGKIRINMNLIKFSAKSSFDFFRECPLNEKRNEKEISDVILNIVKYKKNYFHGITVFEHVPDLTCKSDILVVAKYLE